MDVLVVPRAVASVIVFPGEVGLLVGESTKLVAIARDDEGQVLEGRQVSWTSAEPAVAQVGADGTVVGVAAGSTNVTASVEGRSGSARLEVAPQPVARVELSPTGADMFVGDDLRFVARGLASDGFVLEGREVLWSTSDPGVVTVSATGMARAVAPGTARISAEIEGMRASADVTVAPAPVATVEVSPGAAELTIGGSLQFTAVTRARDGSTLTDRAIDWSSSDPAVASVSPSGLVTAASPGVVTITATSEGRSGEASVTVRRTPVANVEVSPASATLAVGQSRQFLAVTRAEDGSTLTDRAVDWSSSDPAVASVSPSGLVTAASPGVATITATSEGRSGEASVTVTPPPVASVEVSPSSAGIAVLGSVQLTATTKAADGSTLTGRTVTWTSSNSLVATVDGNGLVTGVLPGEATITATSEGQSGTARITVTVTSDLATAARRAPPERAVHGEAASRGVDTAPGAAWTGTRLTLPEARE